MSSLKLSECICPICLCILVEPVTMPCQHELCMPCFKQNVEQANLTCPMCRLRISSWARKQARAGLLINKSRWTSIQQAFPELCKRRMETGEEGEDDVLDLMTQPILPAVQVAEPGEIGAEFKKEAEKLQEQRRRELEEAVKRSEEYIRELQKEEVQQFERRKEELLTQEQQDAELARKLAEEDPHPVIHRGEKVHVVKEQVLRDEEFARRLQMSEQSLSGSPSPKPSNVVILTSSSGSSRKNSSSSIKCVSIEAFLSPASHREQSSARRLLASPRSIMDQPSTSSQFSADAMPRLHAEKQDIEEVKKDEAEDESSHGDEEEEEEEEEETQRPKGAFSPVVLKAPRLAQLEEEDIRAHSTDSNDSISAEMNHFKPIHISPRTAHKKLDNGRADSPPIVFTTPRNLKKMDREESNSPSVGMSSFMKARWQELKEKQCEQLGASSKSTMTNAHQKRPERATWQKSRQTKTGGRKISQLEGPPQKKARMEDAAIRGIAAPEPPCLQGEAAMDCCSDEEVDIRVDAKLQLRVGKAIGGGDATCVDEGTDHNHNRRKSGTLGEFVPKPSTPCGKKSKDLPEADHNFTTKGHDEVDGLTKPNGKKVVQTPIKTYAMREHTKLQTRVTLSIMRDTMSAKAAKNSRLKSDEKSESRVPPLPFLPNEISESLSSSGVSSSQLSQGNGHHVGKEDSMQANSKEIEKAQPGLHDTNKTSRSNGNTEIKLNQTLKSDRKPHNVEISYSDWLASHDCETEVTEESNANVPSDHKQSNVSKAHSFHNGKSSVCQSNGHASRDSSLISKSDMASTSRDDDQPSLDKNKSVTDSNYHCKSQSLCNDHPSIDRKSAARNHGKANGSKVTPSAKLPHKSGDTILRYMELLSEEQQRLRQEEEDRLLAEQLQKEFDSEVKSTRCEVNRAKGTEDAYELRTQRKNVFNISD
ncbi:uncharacterized protein [Diadema antillarum]|uniref:uncharacterized protein isoform X1 n=1 Tax=Diadema antillarum TaxID=105358 RepID=UPI003A850A13